MYYVKSAINQIRTLKKKVKRFFLNAQLAEREKKLKKNNQILMSVK
jgi:hypothetical protein